MKGQLNTHKLVNLILLLAVLLLTSCNPMRKVQRNQKADSTIVDRSEIHKVVTDILRESGTLTQTIVEFYPPAVTPPGGDPDPQQEQTGNNAVLPGEQAKPSPPAIMRIIQTEVVSQTERTTTTDSTAHNDIQANVRSELTEKEVEKPPSFVKAVRWIAIGLIALLLIIVFLKLKKIRL